MKMTTSVTRQAFAQGIHQRHNPFQLVTSHVSQVEVTRYISSQDTVTEGDMQQLTTSFLEALQYYVFTASLIKGILMHEQRSQVKKSTPMGAMETPQHGIGPKKNGNLPKVNFLEAFPFFSKIIGNPSNPIFRGISRFFLIHFLDF